MRSAITVVRRLLPAILITVASSGLASAAEAPRATPNDPSGVPTATASAPSGAAAGRPAAYPKTGECRPMGATAISATSWAKPWSHFGSRPASASPRTDVPSNAAFDLAASPRPAACCYCKCYPDMYCELICGC